MSNPSRVGLGQLSVRMLAAGAPRAADPAPLAPAALVNASASLDTWAGGVSSAYALVDAASGAAFRMAVDTAVHPDADLVATRVSCAAADGTTPCSVALRLAFGYPDGAWGPTTVSYDPGYDSRHTSAVIANASGALSVARMIDDTSYEVHCQWDDAAWTAVRTGPHAFVWLPPAGAATAAVSLSCLFVPAELVYVRRRAWSASLAPALASTASLPVRFPPHAAHRHGVVRIRPGARHDRTRAPRRPRPLPPAARRVGRRSRHVARLLAGRRLCGPRVEYGRPGRV